MTKTFGPYSPVRLSGDFGYVSGQIGVDPDTGRAETDVKSQTKQVLDNLKSVLEGAGYTPEQVVKTTIFLKNIDDFATVNEVYGQFFSDPYPARSCVEVANLPKVAPGTELLVEIDAVIYRGEDR